MGGRGSGHARSYHLADKEAQKRLEELSGRDPETISDVAGELGLARLLAERCALRNPALCNAILATIGKLAIAAQRHAIASSELLSRPALLRAPQERGLTNGRPCRKLILRKHLPEWRNGRRAGLKIQ